MTENSVHEPGAQWLAPQDVDHLTLRRLLGRAEDDAEVWAVR